MRADRLLSMLFLLQANGRMTAQGLAEELEISERTVYRDIEALSIAGIPIYAQRGTNGGISLDEHYRTSLTGLSKDQVLSLFASTEAGPLADIGMARAIKDSLLKLFNTLPAPHQQEVERMRQRFHIDPVGWFHFGDTSTFLNLLQTAVWEDRQVEIVYQAYENDPHSIQVDAYALVSKADKWYLVGRRADGDTRTYRLTRMRDLRLLETRFERDDTFNLVEYWQAARQQFQQQMADTFPPYIATLRIHPNVFWYFNDILEGRFRQIGEPDAQGWNVVEVQFKTVGEARAHVMALGTFVTIIAPKELCTEVLAVARDVMTHYEG